MKTSPRADYRESQHRRAKQSATLAEKFPELAALTLNLAYLNPDGSSRNREIRFSVNIAGAPSVFRVDCLNPDCVGGDYDLSDVLQQAVAIRQPAVTGERCCEGWQNRLMINRERCHQRVKFTLALDYRRGRTE